MQSKLPLWKKINEFAPWIPNLVKGFECRDDVELFIISPHENLKRTTNFMLRGVQYYFIPFGIPYFHRRWPRFFMPDLYSNYYSFKSKVEKIINKINPKVINLHGTENAYYSSSILSLKHDYPILITIQGFISEFKKNIKINLLTKKRIEIEERILQSFTNYSGEENSSVYIKSYNPEHKFFKLIYPVNELLVSDLEQTQKKFDCLFFGRLEKNKGVEDFIKIIADIKLKMKDVKGCIIGNGDYEYLRMLLKEFRCENNIEIKGFLKSQKELFQIVKSSRTVLVPTYKDRLPLTIRESMFIKVPVIAYSTGGIPNINKLRENIVLVKTGNYKEMEEKAMDLIENIKYNNFISENAFDYAIKEFSLKINTERLISIYNEILSD